MLYMVTCIINIPPMLAYIPYMDPMGYTISGYYKPFVWEPSRLCLRSRGAVRSAA